MRCGMQIPAHPFDGIKRDLAIMDLKNRRCDPAEVILNFERADVA